MTAHSEDYSDTGRRRLYLIRHGHVSYFDASGRPLDPRSVPLSADGEAQARALSDVLKGITFDRAISSDYPRAVQTLEMALSDAPTHVSTETTSELREIRGGRLSQIPRDVYSTEVAGAYHLSLQPEAGFLRGERWNDFSERVLTWFRLILADLQWKNLVIASHDAVNRVLISWLMNGNLSALPLLEQDHACINIVDIDRSGDDASITAYLRLLNFTPYNPLKTGERSTVMERLARSMSRM